MGLFFLKCYFLHNFALFPNIYSLVKIEYLEKMIIRFRTFTCKQFVITN